MTRSLPIKVAFLDHTAKLSGGELALARFLPALDPNTVVPLVILGEDGPLAQKLERDGIAVRVLPLSTEISSVRKDTINSSLFWKLKPAMLALSYSFRVAKVLRQENVQIVHTNSLKAAFYGLVAGKLAGKLVVWHIRDTIDISYLPSLAVTLVRKIGSKLPDFVIANSDSTLDSLQLPSVNHSVSIPSGITVKREAVSDGLPLSDFSERRLELSDSITHRICIVGRIARWKGQHVFVEAVRILKSRGYRLTALIAGEPLFGSEDYLAELKAQVCEAQLENDCIFLGFVADVPGLLQTVSVMVHASISPEPFGQVIIEAMATGTPVIASAAGGPLEIITSGETGILVEPNRPEELADAIVMLLDDPIKARTIGEAGFNHVLKNYTIEQTAKRIENIYTHLVK